MALSMWDVWERAEKGPICPEKTFDIQVLFPTVQKLVKKYELKYDPESIVPTDKSEIDRIWQAAMELLTEVGMLCIDTERRILFTEQEIKETIELAPSQVTLGEGRDACIVAHRDVDDKRKPVFWGGPVACPISEEIAPLAYESYAREPALDARLSFGSLTELHGMPLKAGSPFEMQGEKVSVTMLREAVRRAGRPGLSIGAHMSVAARAVIGACNPKYIRTCDLVTCWNMPNMKVDYDCFCKSEHYHDYGCKCYGGCSSFIGGFLGGPEGAAIGSVAESIGGYLCYRIDTPYIWTPDAIYTPGTAARKPLWAAARSLAALNSHTHFITWANAVYQAYAGPCTEMYLQEIAAANIALTPCGAHPVHGGGRSGTYTDYFGGPLDTIFIRDVAYAATKMKREEANQAVKKLLPKYEDIIKAKNPPIGKKFQECNDLKTLKPTKEYLDIYQKVRKDLEGLGLEFDY